MMPAIAAGMLVLLLWAWWFDHYRRRPRRGPGAIDDTRLEINRSVADRSHHADHPPPSWGG